MISAADTFIFFVFCFQCVFSAPLGILLDNRAAPAFKNEPPGIVTFHNNTGTVIPCSAQGTPAPHVTWLAQDDSTLRDVPGLRHVRGDGSLVLPPFRAEDFRQDIHSTVYRCLVSNVVGRIRSRDVNVQAVIYQAYKAQVYDEFVVKGNTGVIRCQVPSFVREYVEFSGWTINDDVTVPSLKNTGKYVVLPTGELYILRANESDGMKTSYRCLTRHRLTGEITPSVTAAQLIVSDAYGSAAPKITDSHSSVRVHEGETAYLACGAQGFPVPTYRWYREIDGMLVLLSATPRVSVNDGISMIELTTVQDSGKYVCLVNNTLGEDRVTFNLIVSSPLAIYVQPHWIVVDIGRTLSLNCTVTGHPVSKLRWFKDGRPLLFDGRVSLIGFNVLHIAKVQKEDEGMFQCFAYNERDSAQGASHLILGDEAPTLLKTFPEQDLRPNTAASLRCVASGNPLPQITWTTDGAAVPDTLRYRLGDYVTGLLRVISYVNITDIRVEDGGEFVCTAGNHVGLVSHAARLNVYGSPVVKHMKNVTALSGEELTIACPYAGHPVDSVVWEKDGSTLPANHRQKIDRNRLTISNVVRPADEGEYFCIVKNPEGLTAKNSLHLRIVVAPHIDAQLLPGVVYTHEGKRTKLLCSVVEGDPRVRVQWTKNGDPVTVGSGITLQNLDDSSVLVFRRVRFRDQGNYTCIAANSAAVVNRTTQLVVNVPPKWTREPINSFTIIGHQVTLDCLADGFPQPSIIWKRAKGTKITEYQDLQSNYRLQVFPNGSLVIQDSELADEGQYLCQANNGVGSGLSKVISLKVHTPPHFERKHQSIKATKDDATVLRCEATGEPPLRALWHQDKHKLDPSSDTGYELIEDTSENRLVSELRIASVTRHNSAMYVCIVTNPFGSDETRFQLIVQESPSAPAEIKVTERTSRSVALEWTLPYSGNSPVTSYLVQYKNATGDWKDDFLQFHVSGDQTQALVKPLIPAVKYNFRLIASNAIGNSVPSADVTVTTLDEVPGGPPLDVNVEATGAQSVKVMWKPPKKEFRHGKIQGYYIGYKVFDSTEQYQYKNVESTDLEESLTTYLTNLRRLTKYNVIVQMYNTVGAGPRSDEVYVVTLEAAPPTSPVVMVISETESSATLHWERSQGDTAVKDYVLFYSTEGGEWKQQRLSTTSDTYTVKDLKCGSRYRMYMTASNSLGTGEPGEHVSVRTKGAAPVSPQKERFLLVNTTSVTLHLSSWQTGGCPIRRFNVEYRPKFQRQWKAVAEVVPPKQDILLLRNLGAGREYDLKVSAYSDAGTTEAEYAFVTINATVERSIGASQSGFEHSRQVPFYRNFAILLPVVISAIVLVIVAIAVGVCLKKQSNSGVAIDEEIVSKVQQSDNYSMTEFSGKSVKCEEHFDKTSYYSSPSRKPIAVSGCKRNKGLKESVAHEYAEPYTAMPVSRCINEEEYRTSFCTSINSEGPYATIKRSPPRTGMQFVCLGQGLVDNKAPRQSNRTASVIYATSSQSGSSGGRTSSYSSDNYKGYRSAPD